MKTGKKIAVGLAAALAIAIFAAGAVSMVGAQDTDDDVSINIIETDFGEQLRGMTKEMHSFDVINARFIDARVEAKFLTEEDGTYGLTSGLVVIPAENFKINDIAFDNGGNAVGLDDVPAGTTITYNAELFVPTDQPDADYTGTVELTFTTILPIPSIPPAPTAQPVPTIQPA